MMLRFTSVLGLALVSLAVHAQSPSNTAYAITSETPGAQHWTEIKQIDLKTGAITKNIFENSKGQ